MPRIRYLKPEFFTDEDLAELPAIARLAYEGLWCYADKAGRLEERPRYLKAMIFPYDNVDMEKQLDLLGSPKKNGLPFIQRYTLDNHKFIQILKWDDHQKPHHTEAESRIPFPPPISPLREDKGNGELKQEQASAPTNNCFISVKERLPNLGQFQNVKLTEEEAKKLQDRFSDYKERIEKLSEYLASSGKKYRSHYATILQWARREGIPDKKHDPNKMVCRACGKETHALVGGLCWGCKDGQNAAS